MGVPAGEGTSCGLSVEQGEIGHRAATMAIALVASSVAPIGAQSPTPAPSGSPGPFGSGGPTLELPDPGSLTTTHAAKAYAGLIAGMRTQAGLVDGLGPDGPAIYDLLAWPATRSTAPMPAAMTRWP